MKRPLFPIVTLALLAASCSSDGVSLLTRPAAPRYGEPSQMVTTVHVSDAMFRIGENVTVRVVARNPTNRVIRLDFTSGCLLGWVVQDHAGSVRSIRQPCTLNVPVVELAPGDEIVREWSWSGEVWNADGSPSELSPGDYRMLGLLNSSGDPPTSQPIEFLVLAP